jgi:hypothetical protein
LIVPRGFYRCSTCFVLILSSSSTRVLPGGRAMPIETFREKCRQVMRVKHLSYRTEETYRLTSPLD